MKQASFKQASLTKAQLHVLIEKGTDRPMHDGRYQPKQFGTFLCRMCGHPLFRAEHQFVSRCGWPSFDDDILGGLKQQADKDGLRDEIVCAVCDGHLGHVFTGEYFTQKNLRHCVNATSIEFVADPTVRQTDEIIIAGGCFWGIEYFMQQEVGVLKVESGYTGGGSENPSYHEVCNGNSGHFEAVRVVFDREKTSCEIVLKAFLEIHDPFQYDGQGVDRGPQYRSAIFVYDEHQKAIAEKLLQLLTVTHQQKVSTLILPVAPFWPAEESHQDFFNKHPGSAICHRRTQRF